MDFLGIKDKNFLVTGVANKKSVATSVAKGILEYGGHVFFSVQNETNQRAVSKIFPGKKAYICDVEKKSDLQNLHLNLKSDLGGEKLYGLLHSIAFAQFRFKDNKPLSFHETSPEDFLQAAHISCFSLTTLTNALKPLFDPSGSIVTISISDTDATRYGMLGPIKACLDSSIAYLAKSLSHDSHIRVNAVCSGPLKTSASAGIPDYIENYLYAEQMCLRKSALTTKEVADTALFLLGPRASGLNASRVLVDAGMHVNAFDEKLVKSATKNLL